MKYAYIRVSSKEQNEARQIKCLEKYDIERYFLKKFLAQQWRGRNCRKC